MKSTLIRDPKNDILLAPGNAALILIDYQPPQVSTVESIDRQKLINNVVALAKTAKLFDLPIILSTVNVSNGVNEDTIPQLADVLKGVKPVDRTSINSWEDEEFLAAVKATGRKKLIMGALWTEACLLFPTLDALSEGYEVYPVLTPSVALHRNRIAPRLSAWFRLGRGRQRGTRFTVNCSATGLAPRPFRV